MSWDTGKAEESRLTTGQASSARHGSKPGLRALREGCVPVFAEALKLTIADRWPKYLGMGLSATTS